MPCLIYMVNQGARWVVISHVITVLLHPNNQTFVGFPLVRVTVSTRDLINYGIRVVVPLPGKKQINDPTSPSDHQVVPSTVEGSAQYLCQLIF